MRPIPIILLFFIISFWGNSQNSDEYIESRGYKNSVYLNPVIVFGFVNPALELGFVRNFENDLATKFGASYLFPESIMNPSTTIPRDASGFRLSLEERFYLERTEKRDEYVSVEFAYLQRANSVLMRFNSQDYYDSTFFETGYDDTVRVHRQTYSLNFNFGKEYYYNRVYLELLIGLGFRYKYIYHTDRINPQDKIEPTKDFTFGTNNNREKRSWGLSMPLAIRVGFTF